MFADRKMLLLHDSGAVSFQNLRTVGEILPTFKTSCLRYGLLSNHDTLEHALLETAACRMPLHLRVMFATLCTSHSCTFQHSCSLQLIPAPSSTPAAFSSFLHLPALSCSLQLTPAASSTPEASGTPAASSTPTASSSLLQFTAHPCGALLTSRVLFQHPLTTLSSAH
ncbi:unnamed protein product [Acanthosepion pharaonis]|uniref:Uncharacterized protein n=1 Tax=Acanthosepion pharaonis TaxID=158019 RepID=A0A812D5B7_ACAPH|nr:unnamed protein product [Sepia pharaonis]